MEIIVSQPLVAELNRLRGHKKEQSIIVVQRCGDNYGEYGDECGNFGDEMGIAEIGKLQMVKDILQCRVV